MAKAMGLVTVGIDIKKDALDNCAKLPEQLRPDLLVDATKPAQEWIPAITALKKDKVFDGLDSELILCCFRLVGVLNQYLRNRLRQRVGLCCRCTICGRLAGKPLDFG